MKHPVVSQESLCKRRVETCLYPALCCPLDSLFDFLRGYHPSGCQGQVVNWCGLGCLYVAIQARIQEFCSKLLSAELHVHTDHKNILNVGDSSQQCLHWISYVDEYGPELHDVEGPHNVIVDTFSRLSRNDESSPLVGKNAANVISDSESDNDNEPLYSSIIDDKEILS